MKTFILDNEKQTFESSIKCHNGCCFCGMLFS